MFKLVALLPLLRQLGPAIFVLSEAFRYGMAKHGDGTWKNRTAEFHVQKAVSSLGQFASSPTSYNLLADAGLRMLFALSLFAAKSYTPKEKPVVETKPE